MVVNSVPDDILEAGTYKLQSCGYLPIFSVKMCSKDAATYCC
jgi:hypothetical protein